MQTANRRLTAALRHVGDRCSLADKATAAAHRFGQPAVPDGRDPFGLVYAVVEAAATLAEPPKAPRRAASWPSEPTRPSAPSGMPGAEVRPAATTVARRSRSCARTAATHPAQ